MRITPRAPLTVLFQTASQWVMYGLLSKLHARGYTDITESHLMLLGNLDCGTTYAAAIAQRMGVSRQAIYRTVRELQALDVLRLEDDPERGNQKLVVMTERGFRLVTQARAALGEIEATLDKRIGAEAVRGLREALENDWGAAPSAGAE